MSDLLGVKPSKLKRAKKRLDLDTVHLIQHTPPTWKIDGVPKMHDSYTAYTVRHDPTRNRFTCSCYGHSYGGKRKHELCTHVLSVLLWKQAHNMPVTMPKVDPPMVRRLKTVVREKPKPDRVLKHFPFPKFRKYQKEVLLQAQEALDSDKHVIMGCPTGFGKSPSLVTLLLESRRGYDTTPLNSLINQMDRDFSQQMLFMRSKKYYPCKAVPGKMASEGPCSFGSCSLVRERERNCRNCKEPCPCTGCEYREAVAKVESAPVVCCSMTMLLVAPFIRRRALLAIDEAHQMESFVRGQIAVAFRADKTTYPDPKVATFGEMLNWLDKAKGELDTRIGKNEASLQQMYAHGIEPPDTAIRDNENDKRTVNKVTALINDYDTFDEEWVYFEETFRDRRRKKDVRRLVFQPVTAYRFIKKLAFDKADRVILSSATPPDPDEVGWEKNEVECIEVPSTFPIENRPIITKYVGRMSMKHKDKTLPKAADFIETLNEEEESIFIHCHSFSNMSTMHDLLLARGVPHVVQDRFNREESLTTWCEGIEAGTSPYIFLSVNMTDGIDLYDDRCRNNVMLKVPWASLGDPVIKKRIAKEGYDFYNKEAARKMAQAYGRGVRSATDYCTTYILDTSFNFFYYKNKKFFPKWFREAMG